MTKRNQRTCGPINWGRACNIFGNPHPPKQVWEQQFDHFDDELQRLARTPYKELSFSDLWYYHHDLAYVELQPDLFAYLFPACLMDWHLTLMRNEACSHGDSEFHYGIKQGKVLERMLTPQQRQDVYEFFRDSFLERLDAERGFKQSGSKTPAYGWLHRFNSLGLVMPHIDLLWSSWWNVETPGQAVAVLQYSSGLIYFAGENPLFDAWTPDRGGGGPYLWENDSGIYDTGWLEPNVDFVRQTLSVEYVLKQAALAAERLATEPEGDLARSISLDAQTNHELLECRIKELPVLLGGERANGIDGWST